MSEAPISVNTLLLLRLGSKFFLQYCSLYTWLNALRTSGAITESPVLCYNFGKEATLEKYIALTFCA